jgi:peptidoglycan/LPS O-acetylase OafA/YrhL
VRNPSLDVLRAAAVLLVFCYHSEGALLISRFGWIGVDLFFVLSGFLVSGLLFREYQATRRVRPGRFLLRRGLKIYPQFYFFIAATLAAAWWRGNPPHVAQVGAELAFVQNYTLGMWTHTWSLAIEEHFYLLLTVAIVCLARRGGRNPFQALPGWIAVSCAVILGLRVLTWRLHPQITGLANVFPSHLRIDSLLTGVFISYFHTFHHTAFAGWMRRFGGWAPPVSILLLAPVTFLTREDPFMVTIGFSLVSWGFGLLLISVLYPGKAAPNSSRSARAMARLGQISYAFYLWQGPVLVAGDTVKLYYQGQGVSIPAVLIIASTFGASLLMATATTRLIERPALHLRDRWLPANARMDSRESAAPVLVTRTS